MEIFQFNMRFKRQINVCIHTRFPPLKALRGSCCSIKSTADAGGDEALMFLQTSYVSSGRGDIP